MQNIQEIFSQLQQNAKEQKSIRGEYRDLLSHDAKHEELTEELKQLREQKKLLETNAQAQMGSQWNTMEELKRKQAELKQMLSDTAVTSYADGDSVEVKDEENYLYEPQFTVTFKKTLAKSIEDQN